MEIATAFQEEAPGEILRLALALLEQDGREEVALIAAPLAYATGDPALAAELLGRVPPGQTRRVRLEHQWRYDAIARDLQPGNTPAALQRLADLLEAAVDIAREDVRGAFYRRALEQLETALTRIAPFLPRPIAPARGPRRFLQRLHLLPRPAPEGTEARALRLGQRRVMQMQEQIRATLRWQERGAFPDRPPTVSSTFGPSRRTLYLTFGSLPHHTNGNTSRTHGLLTAMTAEGWEVRGVTRPGFPKELKPELHAATAPISSDEPWENSYRHQNVLYTNLRPDDARHHHYDALWKFDTLVDAALTLARRDRPALIHGASNHLLGAAAVYAAGRLGLPGIYELRGMWSLDFAALNPDFAGTWEHQRMEALEVEVARRASHVFSISRGLRDFLIARGIAAEKITLLPNGVNPERFTPGPPSSELQQRLGLTGRTVIGFVGTLSHYEGISTLIDALHLLRQRHAGLPFALLLIGNGPARPAVLRQIEALGLSDLVVALPTVPFHEVQEYLRLVDIIAIPRPAHAICELVTPIKPFEAMVLGKTVVASSVGGLTEIITDGETGLIHEKESAESLADTLSRALADSALRERLGAAAREFVLAHHDWRAIVRQRITPVYEKLIGS